MKLKAVSLKRNKVDKPLARLIKKEGERAQINIIRNEKEVLTDTRGIQRIITDCYKQLHVNKMDNREEIDKFLQKYNLSRLN